MWYLNGEHNIMTLYVDENINYFKANPKLITATNRCSGAEWLQLKENLAIIPRYTQVKSYTSQLWATVTKCLK